MVVLGRVRRRREGQSPPVSWNVGKKFWVFFVYTVFVTKEQSKWWSHTGSVTCGRWEGSSPATAYNLEEKFS